MTEVRPSLDLYVETRTVDGVVFNLSSNGAARDRPQGLRFSTKRGDGFAEGSFSLARPMDRDFRDLALLREATIVGEGGDVAYEGRVHGLPRRSPGGGEIAVNCAGWMSHAKDIKFQEVYVDRDLNKWKDISLGRKRALITATYEPLGPGNVQPDDVTGLPALTQTIPNRAASATNKPVCEASYESPVPISSIYYAWQRGSAVNSADANWWWSVRIDSDDTATASDTTGSLRAAGPSSGTLTSTTVKYYGSVNFRYGATGAIPSTYVMEWLALAVYGNHPLTRVGSGSYTTVPGFCASEVIKDIVNRWCPKLNTAGVEATTTVLEQIDFSERIYPYDAFLSLNRAHRWNLSVYDDKTLYFRPTDLTDYDWQVSLSDPGVSVDLQGDDLSSLANGVAVTYTDVATSKKRTITPDTDTRLADPNTENPVNIAGYDRWTELEVSTPVTTEMATQFGIAALGEFAVPKAPGTINVTGHIRDRAGNWQPVWKVRADDRIVIVDHPNNSPRLIVETAYDHDSKAISIGVDAPLARMDAVMDRISMALEAHNLT
jgi:hypothetical protein